LGYVWAHIWSCPPSEGDDYIFHCHPQEMKMPRSKRLCDWYRTILNKAQDRGVITEFKDIHSQVKTAF
jgi:E1A/CREB-binding protein